jgi:hypothetical protein
MHIISEDPLRAQPNTAFQKNTEDPVFKVEIISCDYDMEKMERLESDLGPGRASLTENQTYMSGQSDRRSWAGQCAFPLEYGTVRE